MASLHSSLPPCYSKRSLHFDLSSDPDRSPKRPCPSPSFLQELSEFDSSLDLESPTPEELVVEMMKSLEKVIGAIEQPPSTLQALPRNCHANDEDSPPSTVASCCGPDLEQLSSLCDGADSVKTELEIKHLLEASDDELGIPGDSGNAAIEQTPTYDWAFVDGHCPDPVTPAIGLHSAEGLYSHMLGGWIDGNFDQFEESMAIYTSRDLTSSVCYL